MREDPLDPEYLQALGLLVVDFGALEFQLAYLTWSLLGEDQRLGHLVTAGDSFDTLARRLEHLSEYLLGSPHPKIHEAIKDYLSKAGTLKDRRNQIVHSTWSVDEQDTVHTLRIPRSGSATSRPVEESEIRALALEIAALWHQGVAISNALEETEEYYPATEN